jgi:hypothetical protein
MTAKHSVAISPRISLEFCSNVPPSSYRGRRECRTLGASAAACAVVESTRVSHHGHAGNIRHSPRNGFTAYFALSPVTGLSCHRHRRDAKHHRQLDASVGASGPHDFAVRKVALSSAAQPASIASQPYVRDDRETPLSCGPGWKRHRSDLGQKKTGIFLRGGTGQVASA